MSETDIVRSILDALKAVGAVAWRQQAGRVKVKGGYMHSGQVGIPDVMVLVPPNGRLLGLEVKTSTGKVSAGQEAWHDMARKLGAVVVTVRSAQEAVTAYQQVTNVLRSNNQ